MNISAPMPEYRISFFMTVVMCQESHKQIRMLGTSAAVVPASTVGRRLIEVRYRQHPRRRVSRDPVEKAAPFVL